MIRPILLLFVTVLGFSQAVEFKRVCYWASWAVYRPGDGQHLVEFIDPNLCTHLIYTFAKITDEAELESYDPWCDYDDGLGNFKKFNDLKKKNPKLKTLLAVGGWNMGSVVFSKMARDETKRQKFIQSTLNYVRKYDFDGFDLDWEYPTDRGGQSIDRPNFTKLCKEFKETFEKEGKETGRDPLLITAAVSAGEWLILQAYEVAEIAKHLDFINIMTYDLHGNWDWFVDHNSPLYPRSDQEAAQKKLTASYAVEYWMKHGTPAEKIIMGVPLYGRTFILANAKQNKPGAGKGGPGPAGPFTREKGVLAYYEICTLFKEQPNEWTRVWHNEYQVPYAYNKDFWIGYDDAESMKTKADYIIKKGLGGAMFWSVEQDDYRDLCGGGRDILLRTMMSVLTNAPLPPVPPTPPSPGPVITEPPTPSTTRKPRPPGPDGGDKEECQDTGFFRHPNDCTRFFQCVADGDNLLKYDFNCPEGLKFDTRNNICNFAAAVTDC